MGGAGLLQQKLPAVPCSLELARVEREQGAIGAGVQVLAAVTASWIAHSDRDARRMRTGERDQRRA